MDKVIFVDNDGISRAPMAAGMLKRELQREKQHLRVLVRGLVVSFPQPLNPKTESVMISEGLDVADYEAHPFEKKDLTGDYLILTMDEKIKESLCRRFPDIPAEKCFSFSSYMNEELEIIDPYGGTLQTYGLCFEVIKSLVIKMMDRIRWEI